jgi:hypothetical protein
MLTENRGEVNKTVFPESVRLTKMSIQLFMSDQITKPEMEAFQKRITAKLIYFWWNEEVETAYTAIESELEKHQVNHD